MPDPTLRLTYTALRTFVAEYLGIAPLVSNVAALPIDAHDLDLVGRLVNRGYARFVSESDRWRFLDAPLPLRFAPQSIRPITAVSATTVTVASIANQFPNGNFVGWQVTLFDPPTNTSIVKTVLGYTGATGVFTFDAVPSIIVAGDQLWYAGALNTAGEAWRYFLPDDFYGVLKAPFTYGTTGPRQTIDEVPEVVIREFRSGSRSTGTASAVSFRPVNTDATATGGRWEALFWPEPSDTGIVTAIYKRFPQALSAGTDTSVAGFQHDQSILAAALASAELYRNDRIGIHEQSYQQSLLRSLKLDSRATTARNRPYGDAGETAFVRPFNYASPTSYNGTRLD
jgi:hypothetical protein